MWTIIAVLIVGLFSSASFALRMHRRPRFIANFEEQEYGRETPFIEPTSVVHGLAVYSVRNGPPVLLFPYPHGHTVAPMAQEPIAGVLMSVRRTVISFDVPGAYRSTRGSVGDMDEMIRSADETLERLGIDEPADVVGHSIGGLAALAYAIERPERTRRLVLVTSLSGFLAAARWGFPGSAFRIYEPDYWRVIVWGIRLDGGRGDLALHRRLQNLMGRASYHDKAFFKPVPIEADDHEQGVPVRTIWSKSMYRRLSYADRLAEVRVPTLILAGRHDPRAPSSAPRSFWKVSLKHGSSRLRRAGTSPSLKKPRSSGRSWRASPTISEASHGRGVVPGWRWVGGGR